MGPNKFDIGPINTMISSNYIDGTRFRLSGMTTANLNPHWFLSGYGAYGLKDKRWKYSGTLTYSFNKRDYARSARRYGDGAWLLHRIR